MPHASKSFEILETNKHAEASMMLLRIWRCRRVDKDPEVEVRKECGLVSSRHARNFALAPDVADSFRPWCGDLYKDIVLKDLLCLAVDLVVDLQDIQMILVASGLAGIDRLAS